MDFIECISPLKIELRHFESLVDSFSFEVGQSLANRDLFKSELVIKRFKSNVNTFIKDIIWKLDTFESDVERLDYNQIIKENEERILSLQNQMDSIRASSEKVEKENVFLKKEVSSFNVKLNNVECCIVEKDNIINRLQDDIEMLRISNDKQSKYMTSREKDCGQEVELLQNVIKLKEQEIKVIKRERVEVEKKLKKLKEDNSESLKSIKEHESEIAEYKSKLERCKNLEKIDQRNLITTKLSLNEANGRLECQEDQLKIDLELIKKMKDELFNLQCQVKSVVDQNRDLSCSVEDERKTNLILYKDMECLQTKLTDLSESMTSLTEKHSKLKRKKTELSLEFEKSNLKITEFQTRNIELEKILKTTESELLSLKLKYENLTVQCNSQRKEIKFLLMVKTISDDKIKLLSNFVDDFRTTEHELHSRLISENHSIRTRMDIIKHAYEKLF